MDQVEKAFPELREHVLVRLKEAGRALTTRELGSRLRAVQVRIPDYQIAAQLSVLLKEESVSLDGNRWRFLNQSGIKSQDVTISLPKLSSDTNEQLGWRRVRLDDQKSDSSELEPKEIDSGTEAAQLNLTGRWALFRKLVAYYRQCIRSEEGADASAYQNQLGERFVYLRKVGHWYPWPGTPWQSSIPLGDHLAGLLKCLPGPTDEDTLVVGYPIHGYFKERPGEPPTSIIRPIFYFPVEYTINLNNLLVRNDSPKLEINFNWLEYAFSRRRESQGSFLSACGFINRSRPNDEAPGLELGETSPNLQGLSSALKSFMPDKILEPLNIDSVSDIPLKEPFNTGIYNRAVLMVAKKTRFSVTLLKELAAIEKAPDEVLDQTALRMIFSKNGQPRQSPDNFIHEEVVIDTTQLNAEQRWAVASLINQPLTVVTGPPGTGKSQVVSAAATNARLHYQTVLFASRNHKAIDAVYHRLIDDDGRPLIVRTNSKDDPNLNYTFYKAIKDLLRDQPNPDGAKRISFLREEIFKLLAKRGESARIARQWAKIGTELGEIEERMGYLSCEFPDGMASFLDFHPSLFPQWHFKRISKIAKNMAQESHPQRLSRKFSRFWRCWMLLPWYRLAIKRLKAIPGSPELPPWPTPTGLGTVFQDFLLLEKAAEYAQLRISSKSIEEKSRELPPLEDLTVSLADVTERLKKTANQAIQLDLDSRRGLPEDANREELMGLSAALLAKQTGLEEGRIRSKAVKVLKDRMSYVLSSLPCWAVTNLSAGSRLPLIAGMFDLVIVDEASQSDIPSAIPLLFRARRAGVVGDPFQLTHCSKLSTAKDTLLRREVGIQRIEDVRYTYSEHSLFDLFAGTNGVVPVFLSETYRSNTEIAGYSNSIFYNGRLRVATDLSGLKVPYGFKAGIHWTDIVGEVKSAGGSGCFCQEEVEAITHIVRKMLIENNYRGTLGIVTPFRQQANRIRDTLNESDMDLYRRLEIADVHVDTAHGFQGDERDVIIFSLCSGPEMPIGSRGFLRENANLFNVAASRARAVLHIVGNHEWARKSKIRHIERLTAEPTMNSQPIRQSPWHPHESPYEKMLFNELKSAGLEPRPQFPVRSRRLDMALIRKGDSPIKLDIEVDGDCHRNSDGTRKIDDTWRDIQLQAMGWKVLRFWTYKLREDMPGCVKTVLNAWGIK